jgi:hypothetical protein
LASSIRDIFNSFVLMDRERPGWWGKRVNGTIAAPSGGPEQIGENSASKFATEPPRTQRKAHVFFRLWWIKG